MNTRTLERNTLPPLSVSCIDRVPCNVVSPPFYSFKGGTYKDVEPRHAGLGA
jgi:hypothetical protein